MTDLAPGPGQLIYKPSGPGPVSPGDAQASVDGIVAFFFGTTGTVVNLGGGRVFPCLFDLVNGMGSDSGSGRNRVKFITASEYTLLAADDETTIVMAGSANQTLILPYFSESVGISPGFGVDVIQLSVSKATVAVDGGGDKLLSLSSDSYSRELFGHGAGATIRLLSQDQTTNVRQWALIGALDPNSPQPVVV